MPLGGTDSHGVELTLVTCQCQWLSVSASVGPANGDRGGSASRRANAICRLCEGGSAPWRDSRWLV